MINEKIVKYEGIGDVTYRKNDRARNLTIRINGKGMVKVTVPRWCSYRRAEKFVGQKKNWIIAKRQNISDKMERSIPRQSGESQYIRKGIVKLLSGKGQSFKVVREGYNYSIELPDQYNPEDAEWIGLLEETLGMVGLQAAREQLPEILKEVAGINGFNYQKVTVRRMKTRWGSCSSRNAISLNSSLIFLPDELIEYVCLHELVHTTHKNHSKEFWNALVKVDSQALVHRKELRNRSIIA